MIKITYKHSDANEKRRAKVRRKIEELLDKYDDVPFLVVNRMEFKKVEGASLFDISELDRLTTITYSNFIDLKEVI